MLPHSVWRDSSSRNLFKFDVIAVEVYVAIMLKRVVGGDLQFRRTVPRRHARCRLWKFDLHESVEKGVIPPVRKRARSHQDLPSNCRGLRISIFHGYLPLVGKFSQAQDAARSDRTAKTAYPFRVAQLQHRKRHKKDAIPILGCGLESSQSDKHNS